VWFVGWFGPRGLASLIFALLSLEELGAEAEVLSAEHRSVLATIGLTVLLSVLAHGLSGTPLADRYGRWFARERPDIEASGSTVEARQTPEERPHEIAEPE
jgi:NhaP-type Na+/H+ or K+/H+ antiporter